MHYRSHKWIDNPHTVYERKRELRVRESKHTAMVFDKKYQDIETGKYDSDKLQTLNSHGSLNDLMETLYGGGSGCYEHTIHRSGCDVYLGMEDSYLAFMFPEREKELLKIKKEKQKEEKKRIEEQRVNREKQEEFEELRREWKQKNDDYERRLRERENELARQKLIAQQQQEEMIYLGGVNHGQRIITSKWGR